MPEAGRLSRALARARVPLAFACGALALWLAEPTWPSLAGGLMIAIAGETLRIWAAGHLEKGREITQSGPYRFIAHPLYLGSTLIALGTAVASNRLVVGLLALGYVLTTILPALRTEEAWLRSMFGDRYDAYRDARTQPPDRCFSLTRALRNREHRAFAGLVACAALLAMKVLLSL